MVINRTWYRVSKSNTFGCSFTSRKPYSPFSCAAKLTEVKSNNEMKHETDFTHVTDHTVLKSNNKTGTWLCRGGSRSIFLSVTWAAPVTDASTRPTTPKHCSGVRSGKPIITPCIPMRLMLVCGCHLSRTGKLKGRSFSKLYFFPQ